tara:strand:- start:173 stop:385 length:213 start_codon:yes stop_codon:yes gene_type:complete
MKDKKEEASNGSVLIGSIICVLIGYGWFSTFERVSGDTRWVVDLVGWFFCGCGVLGIIGAIVGFFKDKFS